MEDLTRSRHRLGKMLLRKGVVYNQGNAWTARHRLWLRGLRFEHASEADVSDDYLLAIGLAARLRGLEEKLQRPRPEDTVLGAGGSLRCIRGNGTDSHILRDRAL